MKPGRFFWKLFLGNALLMATVLGASTWLIVWEVEKASREQLTQRLLAQAVTIRHEVARFFDRDYLVDLQATAQELGREALADIRVTMVGIDGTVWADSEARPEAMESHGSRPEIVQALRDGWGEAERWSTTLKREMKYVAVLVAGADGSALGTVRVSMPIPGVVAHTATMRRLIWQTAAIAVAAATALALGLAFGLGNPIRRITETARSLSRGDLSARTRVQGSDEIAQLAESLNQMRDSIARQLQTIDRQRTNLEYLIRSLSEGVIVAGPEGRIVLMNEAACRLLGAKPATELAPSPRGGIPGDGSGHIDLYVGRYLSDCITQPELKAFLLTGDLPSAETAPGDAPMIGRGLTGVRAVRELRLQVEQPSGTVHLLARCSHIELPPSEGEGERAGKLVVLTDITDLTRTIRMKTDFVANASHELRTPLSTIRASVETLEQINFVDDPKAAANFIRVIGKHTHRLEELVNDLLELSRLESVRTEFHPDHVRLDEMLDELQAGFAESIVNKGLNVEMNCPENCREIVVNRGLLRLVIDNLVANAIKFTEPPGRIWVHCARLGKSISIEVRDEGCGIPKEDQDRVFERFYQVERARSGAGRANPGDRGTGLGLSIVRHAVVAMHGNVLLKSQPGKGTSVTVFVPQPG